MVGDHPFFDVESARAAGLSTVWFVAQARRTAELRGEPAYDAASAPSVADAIVADMSELYDAIIGLS